MQIAASREVVFDMIMAPEGDPGATRDGVRLLERGSALGAGQAIDVDAMVAGSERV